MHMDTHVHASAHLENFWRLVEELSALTFFYWNLSYMKLRCACLWGQILMTSLKIKVGFSKVRGISGLE